MPASTQVHIGTVGHGTKKAPTVLWMAYHVQCWIIATALLAYKTQQSLLGAMIGFMPSGKCGCSMFALFSLPQLPTLLSAFTKVTAIVALHTSPNLTANPLRPSFRHNGI